MKGIWLTSETLSLSRTFVPTALKLSVNNLKLLTCKLYRVPGSNAVLLLQYTCLHGKFPKSQKHVEG